MTIGRPHLRRSYAEDVQILPTAFQRVSLGVFFLLTVLAVFEKFGVATPLQFLLSGIWLEKVTTALIIGIAALGFNILVGVTGQVSLGHAVFMGIGAVTGVMLGHEGKGENVKACIPWADQMNLIGSRDLCGLGLPMWIWLPTAALVAVLFGLLIAPAAVKVRGLYLAIVTIGLIFLFRHFATMFPSFGGHVDQGRPYPPLEFRLWKEETPLIDFASDGNWFGFLHLESEQKQFFLVLALLLCGIWFAKNLVRSRTGRALQAIRDRDVAAEVMGVPEFEYKRLGFAISSGFAGFAGALFGAHAGRIVPVEFGLVLSVDFIAILLIGGAGTIAGTMMGTMFVELLPEIVKQMTDKLAGHLNGGILEPLANMLLTQGGSGDFGPISINPTAPGWAMSVFQWNYVIYGSLMVVFMIYEPLGLYGIWLKIRNYWKGWPFSY